MTWLDNVLNAVSSLYGRTGDVVATAGDYTASQIRDDSNAGPRLTVAQFIDATRAGFAAVQSVHGRTGTVTAEADDYAASQIANAGDGQTLAAALDAMLDRFAPVQITWDRANGSPDLPPFAGWQDVDVVLVTNSAGTTGRMGGAYVPTGSPLRRIINASATYDLVLTHDYGATIAVRRFRCPNDTSVTIPPHGSVDIYYSTSQSRWFVRV